MRIALDTLTEELRRLKAAGVGSIAVSEEGLASLRSAVRAAAGAPRPVAPPSPEAAGTRAPPARAEGARLPSPPAVALPAGDKTTRWNALRDLVSNDPVCRAHVRPGKKAVLGVGRLDAEIFFVGEAPGAEEEIQGEPFVGPAGQLLTKMIGAMGLSRSDVYIGNIMNWRPELPPGADGVQYGNRPPTEDEMTYCLPYLRAQIEIVSPRLIVALGATAAQSLLGFGTFRALGEVRGRWREFAGKPLMVTYHPSYILRNQSNRSKRMIWEDLLKVMERAGLPVSDKQRGFFQRSMSFRWLPHMLACAGLLAASAAVRARGEVFDFEMLRFEARMLAAKPYETPRSLVPDSLRRLDYDQYRDIRFNPAENLWRREQLPFQLQFFHPGFIYSNTVQINELSDGSIIPIRFSPKLFDYGQNRIGPVPSSVGFAGFRILYPLNRPGDELGAFLGASYLRFLCQKAVYGLSARGLAVNCGEPGGEEFPAFKEFWVERPRPGATILVVYALLDGPSVTGAFRFVIAPGADTTLQVHEVLYCRRNPAVLGIAPLTSMFWHGENSNFNDDDFRPEVHDSDGLLLHTGAGEWLWRPLTNPEALRVMAMGDENPRGFGLLQRDRNFESYQDLEASYNLRPSAWIEPMGAWGSGSVRLVEFHTPDETNDNIVAFWVPASLPAPGEPIEFAYKLHWFMDQIRPPAAYTVATRHGRSKTHEPDLERFVVDFDGPYLHQQGPDPAIEPVVTVGEGAVLAGATVQKNPFNGTWRVSFALRPNGSGRPVELRCFLRKEPHVLTETWSYLWQPGGP